MIETRIYKCEYCGAEFDDEYEAKISLNSMTMIIHSAILMKMT